MMIILQCLIAILLIVNNSANSICDYANPDICECVSPEFLQCGRYEVSTKKNTLTIICKDEADLSKISNTMTNLQAESTSVKIIELKNCPINRNTDLSKLPVFEFAGKKIAFELVISETDEVTLSIGNNLNSHETMKRFHILNTNSLTIEANAFNGMNNLKTISLYQNKEVHLTKINPFLRKIKTLTGNIISFAGSEILHFFPHLPSWFKQSLNESFDQLLERFQESTTIDLRLNDLQTLFKEFPKVLKHLSPKKRSKTGPKLKELEGKQDLKPFLNALMNLIFRNLHLLGVSKKFQENLLAKKSLQTYLMDYFENFRFSIDYWRSMKGKFNEMLDLDHIPAPFSGMDNLRNLIINDNEKIFLDKYTFLSLPNLMELRLDNNNLEKIPKHLFKDLTSLEILSLKDNNIETMTEKSLKGLNSLQELDLRGNKLEISNSDLKSIRKLFNHEVKILINDDNNIN